jgi:hypothetical protein
MKNTLLIITAAAIMALQSGCQSKKITQAGFLNDYSRLETVSDTSMRYLPPPNQFRQYSQFIIDPVVIHFHTGSKAIAQRSKGKLSEQDLTDLTNYMRDAIVKAVSDRYAIAYQPAPGVARVRVALTDLKKSNVLLNIYPSSKLLGLGLGAVSLEAEIIDSHTGDQIAAFVESQEGNRFSFDGLSEWGDAKAIMDRWAKRFRKHLDDAHCN